MRKVLATAMAAVTLGGAIAVTAAPAQARPHGYYRDYDRHHHRGRGNDALAAGVVGLALGAALASGNNNRGYASYGYYDRPYRGGYGYAPRYRHRVCETERWAYDPYIGRRVLVRSSYRC